jgi:DNA invertase Pin-like site-specific DNA recombinase
MVIRAAIYCRVSRDPKGDRLGVDRQVPPSKALCERLGWEVAEVYTDDDTSAYNGRHRPDYERMVGDAEAGRIQAIACWAADRLTRRPIENEAIIDLAERLGVKLATVAGEYDLATPSGRLHFRQLGIIARYESEHRADRLRLKHEELARAGKVHGRGTRPFGYEADRVTVRQDEAELIREATRRLLAGESLRRVMRDWNARAITTSAGGPWTASTFARMLRAARLAGKREHHGVVVADAVWPAIITPTDREQLLAVLDGARAWGPSQPLVRRYLLTGFLACSRCGAKLIAQPRMDKVRSYACAVGAGRAGCGRTTRLAEPLEAHVRDAVIAALDSSAMVKALRAARGEAGQGEAAALAGRVRADEAALEQLALDHYVDRVIGRAEFLAARATLEGRITANRRALGQLAERQAALIVPDGGGAAVREAWEAGDLEWRRALLAVVVDRVVLHPCVRGRPTFDPTKVEIVWRA